MATSTQVREWWKVYRCKPAKMVRVSFPGAGQVWNLLVAKEAAPAWQDFINVMGEYGYTFRESAGGTFNCRRIRNSVKWSTHAYGVAIDLNPRKNPRGRPLRHDYPPGFVAAIEGLRFNGKQAFRWGGRWRTPDPMHWQINIAPADIDQDNNNGDEEVKNVVKGIQRSLRDAGFNPGGIDGDWGPRTELAHSRMTKAAAKTGGGSYTDAEAVAAVKRAL